MSAVPETLFESELFGHVKGAFTDAREDRAGRFESGLRRHPLPRRDRQSVAAAPGQDPDGLENRQIVRVGSSGRRPSTSGSICATNRPVHQMVAQNRFRQDLLYRINTIEVRLPPLRDTAGTSRSSSSTSSAYCRKYGRRPKTRGPAALLKLGGYAWPGNVRELQHAVERAVIMSDTAVLQPDDFLLRDDGSAPAEPPNGAPSSLEDLERRHVDRILSKHGGNVSKAARELGISRAALYRRLEKHGL